MGWVFRAIECRTKGRRAMSSILVRDQATPPMAPPGDAASGGGPSRILLGVFETLDREGIPYCVLHGYESYPEQIRSDVDCMISAAVRPRQLAALLHENRAFIGAELVRARGDNFVL